MTSVAAKTQERMAAGAQYAAGIEDLDWYTPGDQYLAVDSNGYPAHPEWYSDEFLRMARQAGHPRIRLHDSRHTSLSLMEKAGVPISIISKWAGHCDSAFTNRTYVHANDDDLDVAVRLWLGNRRRRTRQRVGSCEKL